MVENEFKVKNKELFLALSCISVGCLVGSFAFPLQKFEVWRQTEPSIFGQEYSKTFVLSEADQRTPYGLDRSQGRKIATIYTDAKTQKLLLLVGGIMGASTALAVGASTVENAEIEAEVKKIDIAAKKEVLIDKIKHKWAMASEAQKQLYREEYKALVEMFGEETQEVDEINETDKFINASYMLAEGHNIDTVVAQTWKVDKDSQDFERLKKAFQEWLDKEE